MNFMYGTRLAIYQDILFNFYKEGHKIGPENVSNLKENLWIPSAEKVAPNNLVVRHLALLDLVTGNPANYSRILKLINKLSRFPGDPVNLLWAEGYSYWGYTRAFLVEYLARFNFLGDIIKAIENNFIRCGYERGSRICPAPFGDLRDVFCDLEGNSCVENITIGPVKKSGDIYVIKAWPVGLNCHTLKKDVVIKIVDGRPKGFKYYEGYDKKYKGPFGEYIDMLAPSRVKSIFSL